MARRIFQYAVPIDDKPHSMEFTGPIVHVDRGNEPGTVNVWAIHDDHRFAPHKVRLIVVGTGHEWPAWASEWHGTAPDARTGLVWHLVGTACPHA